MSLAAQILIAVVILLPVVAYLAALIWGAIQDGRIARRQDRRLR
jgi:hypothetical protein